MKSAVIFIEDDEGTDDDSEDDDDDDDISGIQVPGCCGRQLSEKQKPSGEFMFFRPASPTFRQEVERGQKYCAFWFCGESLS